MSIFLLATLLAPIAAMALPLAKAHSKLVGLFWLMSAGIAGVYFYLWLVETHDVSRAFVSLFFVVSAWPVIMSLVLYFTRSFWSSIGLKRWLEIIVLFLLHSAAFFYLILLSLGVV